MATRFITFVMLLFLSSPIWAQLQICNKSNETISIALYDHEKGFWRSRGWLNFKPGECSNVTTGPLKSQYFYIYAEATKTDAKWQGDATTQCVTSGKSFEFVGEASCESRGGRLVGFQKIDTGNSTKYTAQLDSPTNPYVETVKTGVIQERCLIRYDDSHQMHSISDPVIEWNYQRGPQTTMKKLEHCIKITVTGPLSIEGVAKSFVDSCVNYGLNHNKTLHILGLLGAISADVWGGGMGVYSTAKVSEYVASATTETISCLTDQKKITEHIKETLEDRFDATVRDESRWVYWTL